MGQQKEINSKTYKVSEDVRKIAEEIIKNEKVVNVEGAKIEYLVVYPHISQCIVGRCNKANKHTKFFSDFDYIIEFSGEAWDQLDEDTRKILVLHELMHVLIKTDKHGTLLFQIKDHDVKDFSHIISKHGIDWFSDLKAQIASIYDLEPADEDKITL
jgi:predicted metallopeptidase